MCDVLDHVEKKGIEKGIQRGIETGIENATVSNLRSLMETLKLTAQQAMDALKIPAAERGKYAARL